MTRREVITLFGGTALAWPLAARAQPVLPNIGFFNPGSAAANGYLADAFRLITTGRIERAVDAAFAQGLKPCEFGGSDGTAAVARAVLAALDQPHRA